MSVEPWSPEAFEARYREQGDPWDFAHSAFEQGRYDDILDSIPTERCAHAYEPGCSIGALTVRLAARCDRLDAVDVSATAVARARERCRALRNVRVAVGSVIDPPPSDLDLIVFAEIGYYFAVEELDTIATRLRDALRPDGHLLACHWLGESADHRLHGRLVHDRLHEVMVQNGEHVESCTRPDYVIDVWRRA
jgi:SAM-dependent methyltransferase